jgi:hypothetical protein
VLVWLDLAEPFALCPAELCERWLAELCEIVPVEHGLPAAVAIYGQHLVGLFEQLVRVAGWTECFASSTCRCDYVTRCFLHSAVESDERFPVELFVIAPAAAWRLSLDPAVLCEQNPAVFCERFAHVAEQLNRFLTHCCVQSVAETGERFLAAFVGLDLAENVSPVLVGFDVIFHVEPLDWLATDVLRLLPFLNVPDHVPESKECSAFASCHLNFWQPCSR